MITLFLTVFAGDPMISGVVKDVAGKPIAGAMVALAHIHGEDGDETTGPSRISEALPLLRDAYAAIEKERDILRNSTPHSRVERIFRRHFLKWSFDKED